MLGFLLFIIVFVLVIGLAIVFSVLGFLRSIFSFGRKKQPNQSSSNYESQEPAKKQKIFDSKEGEYVDYEEIK